MEKAKDEQYERKERERRRDEKVKEKEEENKKKRWQEDAEGNRKIIHYYVFEIIIKNALDMILYLFLL